MKTCGGVDVWTQVRFIPRTIATGTHRIGDWMGNNNNNNNNEEHFIHWVRGSSRQGQSSREVDHSPPTSAEVKNTWICISSSLFVIMA
jgi:hypothetical protein